MRMNSTEKILLFRSCGMILWVLKQVTLSSRIDERKRQNTLTRLNQLIKDVTDYINYLRASEDEF